MSRKIMLGLFLAFVLSTSATAVVPTSISVQGKVTDSAGVPLPAGSKQFVFSIHNAESGGTKIWPAVDLEYQLLVTDASGLWSANVGAVVPLTDLVFLDSVRWLEVAVDVGTPVVLPRVRLVTGPYTFRVSTVDGASGGTITTKLAIGPGHSNGGEQGFIAGANNNARGAFSSVSGGQENIAYSDSTHVGGGGGNTAFGMRATVGGGANNETGGDQATVAGGRYNKAMGLSSTVGGGYENIAVGVDAHIGGGSFDSASGSAATVAGGSGNRATGHYNTIGGGGSNRTSATSATIAGGFQNVASADDATVGGGYDNQATGFRSTVPGGTGNLASGANSLACGVNAWADGDQSFVWSDDPGSFTQSLAPRHFIVGCSGRIGLGTNVPEGYLHVHDGSAGAVTASVNSIAVFERDSAGYVSILTPSSTERGILFGQPGSVADGGIIYAATSPRALQFRTTGNATRMILDHDEFSTNESRLTLISPIGTSSALVMRHFTGTAEASLTFDQPGSPDQLIFSVLGTVRMRLSTSGTTINGQLTVAGNVCATNIACPSDERLKQQIRPLGGGIAALQGLQPVRYHWRDDVAAERDWSKDEQIGLLAQDVRKTVPQAVVEMPDGYLAVDYARLVPLLIEAMKEQQKQIEDLKARIDRQDR